MICLGTWWKVWMELDALSTELSRHKYFSEVNSECKNILSSICEILVAFCFFKDYNDSNQLSLLYFLWQGKRRGMSACIPFRYHSGPATVEMEECLFILVPSVWALIKVQLLAVWKSDHYWSSKNCTKNDSFQRHIIFPVFYLCILHLTDILSLLLVVSYAVTSQTHSAHTFWTRLLYEKMWLLSVVINI